MYIRAVGQLFLLTMTANNVWSQFKAIFDGCDGNGMLRLENSDDSTLPAADSSIDFIWTTKKQQG